MKKKGQGLTFAICEGCLAAVGVVLVFFSCHLASGIVGFLKDELDIVERSRELIKNL
jgi:hypothetical protein